MYYCAPDNIWDDSTQVQNYRNRGPRLVLANLGFIKFLQVIIDAVFSNS